MGKNADKIVEEQKVGEQRFGEQKFSDVTQVRGTNVWEQNFGERKSSSCLQGPRNLTKVQTFSKAKYSFFNSPKKWTKLIILSKEHAQDS